MSAERDDARWEIIRAANKHKLSVVHPFPVTLLGMRHLQSAVCTARRFRAVER